jgi:CBS domain-containing protein
MSLPEAKNAAYNSFFSESPLECIARPALGKVVTVKSTDSVRQVTRDLGAANILSAPVRDVDQPDDAPWLEKYIGTIDAVNLMYWMLEKTEGKPVDHIDDMLRHAFADTPVQELVNLDVDTARFNPFIPLSTTNNTMLDVMLLLGKYAQHRAYVVEPGGDVVNVITQSALVKFLHSNMDKLSALTDAKLGQFPQCGVRSKLASVTEQQNMWDAFKLMRKEHVSAVPVVDANGVVKGVVSARDARLMILRPTRLRFLNQPLELFEDLHVSPFDAETVCCTEEDTIASIITKLDNNRIHRVFLVDGEGKLKGVIALRDIIALFVKEPRDSSLSEYFTPSSSASAP